MAQRAMAANDFWDNDAYRPTGTGQTSIIEQLVGHYHLQPKTDKGYAAEDTQQHAATNWLAGKRVEKRGTELLNGPRGHSHFGLTAS